MTPAERAAVHRMAGAFALVSGAAEAAATASADRQRVALIQLERWRSQAFRDFTAAMDELRPQEHGAPPCAEPLEPGPGNERWEALAGAGLGDTRGAP